MCTASNIGNSATDAEGRISFKTLKQGMHTIQVDSGNYKISATFFTHNWFSFLLFQLGVTFDLYTNALYKQYELLDNIMFLRKLASPSAV